MREENKKLRFLLDISTNIFIETDAYGRILSHNRKAAAFFDTPELNGSRLSDYFSSEAVSALYPEILGSLHTSFPAYLLLNIRGREFNIYLYPLENSVILCLEDITERRALTNMLGKISARLEFAEKTAKLGYWELDIRAKRLYWSAEMYNLFGVSPKGISSKENLIRKHIVKEDYPLYKEKLRELVKKSSPVEGQVRIRQPAGNIIYCRFQAGIISDGGSRRIAGTFQDLSRLIETQKALEKAREEAISLNRGKSYFLAQASHDLRQPMQALKIFISTLEEEKLNKRQKSIVQKIDAAADNLNYLLNNLLDISKLDAGGFTVEIRDFNIGTLLESLLIEFREIARSKNIKFLVCGCRHTVTGDPVLIERVIRNLLSNAFKYAENKVLLGCKRRKNILRIMVMDNGCGIGKDELDNIFEEFYQSKNIRDNNKMGAGLGLSIIKRISELLNIKIKVSSVPGRGSCFSFELPLSKKLPAGSLLNVN